MKKLISPKMQFLLVLILLSTFLIYNKTNSNNITYLSLGDSYALGINSYGIEDYGYSDYLKDKFKDKNKLKFYTKHFSSKDMSIKVLQSNITNNIKSDKSEHKIGLKEELQNTDILTLNIGLNDLKYSILLENEMSYNKLDLIIHKITEDFDELIKEIRKYYKKDIYVIGYPINYLESYYLSLGIRKLNESFQKNKNITFISTSYLEQNKNKFFSNPKSNYYNREAQKDISIKIYNMYIK